MGFAPIALLACSAFAQQIQLPRTRPKPSGQILVATAKSQDHDLGRSVVLILHADVEGIVGLVVNHPVAGTKPPTWFGGPIPLEARELFRSRVAPKDAENVFADVYVSQKIEDRPGARVYAGYVGWSVPQWRNEMDRGLWRAIPAQAGIVFDPHPETLWRRLSATRVLQ